MSETTEAVTRLSNWIDAGDKAQDKYGYQGSGRMPIETDIRILLKEIGKMRSALQTAETVLEGVVVIRRPGDILDTIHSVLES